MAFRVGQRVVCINDGPMPIESGRAWDKGEEVVVGHVYTIRKVFIGHNGEESCWLNEVCRSIRAVLWFGRDVGYRTCRFRPLVERKNDKTAFVENLKKICMPSELEKVRRQLIDA